MVQPRLFTLKEATSLMPKIRHLVESMQTSKRRADAARTDFEQLDAAHARGNGYDMKREQLATLIIERMKSVREGLDELQQLGIELKDLEMGLIDFPSLRQEQVVNLCWKIDELEIGYWHSLDTGFAHRQPL